MTTIKLAAAIAAYVVITFATMLIIHVGKVAGAILSHILH